MESSPSTAKPGRRSSSMSTVRRSAPWLAGWPPKCGSTSANTPWLKTPSHGPDVSDVSGNPATVNGSRNLLAPVRVNGSWTMAENGSPIWEGRFIQLWNQRLSPDGRRMAAVAAPGFGQWTVVVDDMPWRH